MTDDLATALHTMADSDQPPVMDVEHVLHEGRRGLARRRMAALGGGTAVLAVTALAVGTLTGMGSGVQGGSGTDSAAASTFTVDPHDPVVTHWQFAYVPPGMTAYGGYDPTDEQLSTTLASGSTGFALDLVPMQAPIAIGLAKGPSAPTQKVPVKVPGTTTAYWLGHGGDRITMSNGRGGQMAELALRLENGQWVQLEINNLQDREDWKEQTLKAAASLVRKDRSVPMPFQLAGALPQSFVFRGGSVRRVNGIAASELMYRLGPENAAVEDIVSIGASTTSDAGKSADPDPNMSSVCKDSKGLTLCVYYPKKVPAALTAIGGPQALLDRMTSLGSDPADWTTDVIR